MMLRAFYILVATFAVLNGMTMLLTPETWYEELVPGVEHTGPMNTHFERDIGLAFLAFGLGLAWAAFHPASMALTRIISTSSCVSLLCAHAMTRSNVSSCDVPSRAAATSKMSSWMPMIFTPFLACPAPAVAPSAGGAFAGLQPHRPNRSAFFDPFPHPVWL